MTIHSSLRGVDTLKGERSVLSRIERIEKLARDGVVYVNVDSAAAGPDFRGGSTPALQDFLMQVTAAVDHPDIDGSIRDAWATRFEGSDPQVETIVGATYKLSADLMGPKPAAYFLPLIGACALGIWFSNALGLIPGFLPPTDNFNTTFAMAIVIFFVTHVYGVKEHGFVKYFSHFFGPKVPWWIAWFIAPLMFVIEMISHVVRPITLGIRLMANMTADHMVLGIFVGLFAGMGLVLLPVPVVFYLMGVLVVTVQTLVFCLLSVIYITLAIQHEEEH